MNRSVLAYNDVCRKVLSDKRILSYLLKITMEDYEKLSIAEIEPLIEGNVRIKEGVHTLFPRNNEVINNNGKIVYDLLFTCRLPNSKNWIDFIVNIEMQHDYYPKSRKRKSYPILKRAIFYTCTAMAEEKGTVFTSDNYEDVKKVVSIWINTKPPKSKENSMMQYRMYERHMGGREYKEKKKKYDLLEVVMINLGQDDSCEKLKPLNELFVKTNSAEEKFKVLKEEYGIEAYEETTGKVKDMCNLGEGLVYEGMTKGAEKEKLANIKTLMETMNASYEEVTLLLKLSEKDKVKFKKRIFE